MYNLRKGTELLGEKADAAVLKELSQVDEFETDEPKHLIPHLIFAFGGPLLTILHAMYLVSNNVASNKAKITVFLHSWRFRLYEKVCTLVLAREWLSHVRQSFLQ